MTPLRRGSRAIVLALAAAAVLVAPVPTGARGAWAAPAPNTPEADWTNVRPFFAFGYTRLEDFGDLDHGFGVSAGFEIEGSPHLSYLFRAEWNRLQGEFTYVSIDPAYPYSNTYPVQETAYTWTAG